MAAASAKRILVVEDQDEVARVLLMMLLQHGHTVEIAHRGADAIGQVAAFAPDVVLLDLVLPEVRGEDVAAQIRQLRPTIRIVGMTGGSFDEAAGDLFDEMLEKPFSFEALVRAL